MTQRPRFEVLAMGEVLIRLAAPSGSTLESADHLDVTIGGAEANVAVAHATAAERIDEPHHPEGDTRPEQCGEDAPRFVSHQGRHAEQREPERRNRVRDLAGQPLGVQVDPAERHETRHQHAERHGLPGQAEMVGHDTEQSRR